MDSLRIDIIGKEEKVLANELSQKFLRILREYSFQWWINHSVHPITGTLRNTFSIEENGKPVELPISVVSGYTPNKWTIPINSIIWTESLQKLNEDYQPNLSIELLLDGLYFQAAKDLRRAVIDFAISCEYAKDQCFKRLWIRRNGSNKTYKRGKVLSGNSLPVHLDLELQKFGYSYKVDKPKEYDLIKELWDVRGNVAHGEELKFRRNGHVMYVDEKICDEFSKATFDCIKWLGSL